RRSTPPPPIIPKLRWPSPMRADRPAMATSQLRSSSSPPAAVTPLTRATDGTRTSRNRVALQLDIGLEVTARAEGAPGTGDEERPHLGVGCERVDGPVQLAEHVAVDGVELLGPVERDQPRLPDAGGHRRGEDGRHAASSAPSALICATSALASAGG